MGAGGAGATPVLARTQVATFGATIATVDPLPARAMVRVILLPDADAGLPPRIRVNIADADRPAGLAPGARLALRARLLPPAEAAVPGGYDYARVAWFQRIGATGKALPGIRVTAPAPAARDGLAAVRARMSAHIQARLPGAAGGFATALATGDQARCRWTMPRRCGAAGWRICCRSAGCTSPPSSPRRC